MQAQASLTAAFADFWRQLRLFRERRKAVPAPVKPIDFEQRDGTAVANACHMPARQIAFAADCYLMPIDGAISIPTPSDAGQTPRQLSHIRRARAEQWRQPQEIPAMPEGYRQY